MRLIHLRDTLFLVGYAQNELEIIDINTRKDEPPRVVDSIKIGDHDNYVIDFDFHIDESCIVAVKRDSALFINMKTK